MWHCVILAGIKTIFRRENDSGNGLRTGRKEADRKTYMDRTVSPERVGGAERLKGRSVGPEKSFAMDVVTHFW